jgi:hypothetical protein
MYGSAKTAMRNVANGVKEWKLRWDWEPAGDETILWTREDAEALRVLTPMPRVMTRHYTQ